MVKINQSIQNINNRMSFEGLDNSHYSVRVKRYQGFIGKIMSSFINLFSKSVPLNVEDIKGNKTEVMVNVNSLAKRLGVAKNEINEHAKKNNLETFIDEKRLSILDERKKLREEEEDRLYNRYRGAESGLVINENYQSRLLYYEMTAQDARTLAKAIVTLKFSTVISPTDSDRIETELVTLSSTRVHLVATADKENPPMNKITALFGKILGEGGFGVAMRTTDATTKTSAKVPKHLEVLKLPKDINALDAVLSSAHVVADLHKLARGKPEGIQDRIRIVTNKQTGDIGTFSSLYDGSLEQIERSGMTPSVIAHGFKQLCAGLAFMHKNNIAHRDIKPENILVRMGESKNDWKFHLADFDLVNYHNKTIDQNAMGTPGYKGSNDWDDYEVAVSNNELNLAREIDLQADIFALCATFYALATGDYKGSPNLDQLRAHIQDNELCELIIRGVSQDRTQRPSIEEIKKAVDKYYKKISG